MSNQIVRRVVIDCIIFAIASALILASHYPVTLIGGLALGIALFESLRAVLKALITEERGFVFDTAQDWVDCKYFGFLIAFMFSLSISGASNAILVNPIVDVPLFMALFSFISVLSRINIRETALKAFKKTNS